MGTSAAKSTVNLPPSPRHVHVGGRSEALQKITPFDSEQVPLLVSVIARILVPGGGSHENESINPIELVFVTESSNLLTPDASELVPRDRNTVTTSDPLL